MAKERAGWMKCQFMPRTGKKNQQLKSLIKTLTTDQKAAPGVMMKVAGERRMVQSLWKELGSSPKC